MNSSSTRLPTPQFLKDKKKLAVGLRDIFLHFANVNFATFTFHDNMYIGNTSRKWFKNCSLVLWSSLKVDIRHLGMSLAILVRALIIA